jgi:hypothetical protein
MGNRALGTGNWQLGYSLQYPSSLSINNLWINFCRDGDLSRLSNRQSELHGDLLLMQILDAH